MPPRKKYVGMYLPIEIVHLADELAHDSGESRSAVITSWIKAALNYD